MILFHYTCVRNAALIDICKELRPRFQPMFDDLPMVFLTTMIRPSSREQLGLTWHINRTECAKEVPPCDPAGARFSVLVDPRSESLVPFPSMLRHWPDLKAIYETFPRAVLGSWWVSSAPVPIYVPQKPQILKGLNRGQPARHTLNNGR